MHSATTTKGPASDTIALLYPYDRTAGVRTGVHPGKTYHPTKDIAYDIRHMYYQTVPVTFRGVKAMHSALVTAADEGQAFMIRGQRAHRGTYVRRISTTAGFAR